VGGRGGGEKKTHLNTGRGVGGGRGGVGWGGVWGGACGWGRCGGVGVGGGGGWGVVRGGGGGGGVSNWTTSLTIADWYCRAPCCSERWVRRWGAVDP